MKLEKKYNWFITGAAGFVASHICDYLIRNNQNIIAVDNFLTGLQSNIDYLKEVSTSHPESSFNFYNADICDTEKMIELSKGCEKIIHQAALGSVPRSIKLPVDTHQNNVNGFISILEAARANNIKRVVYASSSSVYGDSPKLPKVEYETGKVLSPYAATKAINEVYADAYTSAYKMELIGLRYFNIFGPRQNPNGAYAAVIPKWIGQLLEGDTPTINGDGTTSRDFCYVDNAVLANILASITSKKEAYGEAFNIACEEQTSLNTLYDMINKGLNSLDENIPITEALYRDFRQGDIKHSLANISKAKKLLNYSPMVLAHEGISATVEYFFKEKRKL
ncbi:Vi polysaccharide biosynthesis protein VipB/TviC [Halobacteriovorax sp. BALOs_7]|uniref:NAD-dependent epimerase/dehydratase family protein n=1 Tax=Halobacteriovorax TaxID=1652133 RepID=UPI000EB70C99|nr:MULTISPECIES: NAD-dependent epimerase/dehydratase family protein [Halobacteriovorax]AYF43050.1 Vi polysaccharide biosynthesis protein VipB/TviC [Halobacteriovorax sp. BALOs_7]